VIERSKQFRFPLKPAHSLEIRGQLLGQDLQGHVLVELGVGGTVDLAHTAFTDLLQNFVMADAGPDQDSPSCNTGGNAVKGHADPVLAVC